MTTLLLETDPEAVDVAVTDKELAVILADGRRIVVPLEWYPRLVHATFQERKTWRLLGNGYAIEWPELDEHIGVEALLAGRRSGESKKSLVRWFADRAAKVKARTTSRVSRHPHRTQPLPRKHHA